MQRLPIAFGHLFKKLYGCRVKTHMAPPKSDDCAAVEMATLCF